MTTDLLPADVRQKWEIHEWRHAIAILRHEFPDRFEELVEVLRGFKLLRSHLLTPGGNNSPIALELDGAFARRGWVEQSFDVSVNVNKDEYKCVTHHVDYYKDRIDIETEWNNSGSVLPPGSEQLPPAL